MDTNWNKKELLAYLLIYCMRVDCVEQTSEIEYIQNKVGKDIYDRMHLEFDGDNDFISINKIQSAYKRLNLNLSEKDQVIHDIKEIFEIDGRFEVIEHGIQLTLNRVLKD